MTKMPPMENVGSGGGWKNFHGINFPKGWKGGGKFQQWWAKTIQKELIVTKGRTNKQGIVPKREVLDGIVIKFKDSGKAQKITDNSNKTNDKKLANNN